MAKAYINIGSNQGDRHALIEQAVALIQSSFHTNAARSSFIESEPWGFESSHPFLNLGILVDVDLTVRSPEEVLHTLLYIEQSISPGSHRDKNGNYIDRKIDIDLIAIDDIIFNSPVLTLPHPLMHRRSFVLNPLLELWDSWIHPVLGQSVQEMLKNI